MGPNPLAARNREHHQTASFNITDQLTRFSFQKLDVQMEGVHRFLSGANVLNVSCYDVVANW